MSKEAELGTLVVVVLKARNLIDKHSFYKQDVFAQVALNGVTKKTRVDVKGGQHPVWDDELRFPVMKAVADKSRKLEVACFAKEPRNDELLGKGTLDISETLRTGEFDDWVGLDIDGVARGELYLEMTYFSSGPAPAVSNPSSLTVPAGQNLTRRPSKLSPSERLYRPPQKVLPQPVTASGPTSSPSVQIPPRTTSHSPSKAKDAALPPLPEDQTSQTALPGILLPGGGVRPKPQSRTPSPGSLPSLLRPGNRNVPIPTSRPPNHTRHPSASPPPSNLRADEGPSPYMGASSPNPYIARPSSASSIPSVIPPNISSTASSTFYTSHASHYTSLPSSSAWDKYGMDNSVTTGLSFPVPLVPPPTLQPDHDGRDPYRSSGYHQAINVASSSGLDRHLQARYQTPLPLPPGTDDKPLTDLPRGRQPDPRPNPGRLEALRLAEEEAARRREQEQKDLELALQLDRELNT